MNRFRSTWLGIKLLPDPVLHRIEESFPEQDWEDPWPDVQKFKGEKCYIFYRRSKPPIVISETGKILSKKGLQKEKSNWKFLSYLLSIVRGIVSLFIGIVFLFSIMVISMAIWDIFADPPENAFIEDESSVWLTLLFAYFTIFALLSFHFLRPMNWNVLKILRRRIFLGSLLALAILFFPFLVLAQDAYTFYTPKGIVSSNYWEWNDQQKVSWKTFKEVRFTTRWGEESFYLVFEGTAKNGKTFLWQADSHDEVKGYMKLVKKADETGIQKVVKWMTDEELFDVYSHFGDEPRKFFYEKAQYFEKKYPGQSAEDH
ncbi:ABC transporter ATP-binding protein [Melghirimyces algeriensis]|uniref:Uncharacterized protein n=1 Tax=Melghirimyces algeriensis TaxID=910412 RepID=A0A521EGK1_9BACL|nr:ABC transporter ATP-binding protein [Melghirimyces algeriensis]SMO83028.1 hypothetical protein SAMN06264849_10943 [Melghirimyces algeriensis]